MSEVPKVLSFLAALYPRFTLTPATIKAYRAVLDDIPPDLLQMAAQDMGSRSIFFPAAAELRQAAFSLLETAEGELSSADAWGLITDYYQGKGRRDELPPAVQETVRMIGGWRILDNSSDGQMVSHRARFLDIYDAVQERQKRERRMLPAIRERVGLPADNEIKQLAAKLSVNGDNNANR